MRYYLTIGDEEEREVSLEEFCEAERACGILADPTLPLRPVTGGFGGHKNSSGGIYVLGRVEPEGMLE
jgi:hypothetical protein